MTRRSSFWVKRRTAPLVEDVYPDVYASTLDAMTIVRRDADAAIVSGLEGMSIVRRDADAAIVSHIEAMTILKQGSFILLNAASLSGNGSRSASTTWSTKAAGEIWYTAFSGLVTYQYDWLLAGTASSFEIRATILADSGVVMSGTYGSWLNLGTNRDWTWSITGRRAWGEVSALFEIRDTATSTLQASAVVYSALTTDGGIIP